jgi:C1A family cysteine protease
VAPVASEASPMNEHGLGALQSPPDERDFPIADLLASAGEAAAIALPPIYVVPLRAPILDQGNTPMCVAYSTASLKAYQDRDDQAATWWDFDEPRFFAAIGGNAAGAYLRNALDRLLKVGYPVVGSASPTSAHKIRAYYAVPKDIEAIKRAIFAFGQIVLVGPWYHSWLTPNPKTYVLPRPDYAIGGHAIVADGWNDKLGLRLRNSWGMKWGYHGDAYMPWAFALAAWEFWKTVDA